MSTPFLGEIKIMSFDFAPKGWAQCNGQLLPINQNQALFSLYGTQFGGDGRVNFALPDFRGRTAIHQGEGFVIGERFGESAHTLSLAETPVHTHEVDASPADGTQPVPGGAFLARTTNQIYAQPPGSVTLNPLTIGNSGGSQPHDNSQPYLVLNFCCALQGVFPSRN
jgi:microcystin-dependent protein